jgi:hypothetical protein
MRLEMTAGTGYYGDALSARLKRLIETEQTPSSTHPITRGSHETPMFALVPQRLVSLTLLRIGRLERSDAHG